MGVVSSTTFLEHWDRHCNLPPVGSWGKELVSIERLYTGRYASIYFTRMAR